MENAVIYGTPARRLLLEAYPIFYPFGGIQLYKSQNVLEDYRGSQPSIKILFLDPNDLMSILHTVTSKSSDGKILNIHSNQQCLQSFARNILILKIISATSFDVNKVDNIGYLWDIWYNIKWTKTTVARFQMDVKSLIEDGLPVNCSELSKQQYALLKDLLLFWLFSLSNSLMQPTEMKRVLEERSQFQSINDGKASFSVLLKKKEIKQSVKTAKLALISQWSIRALDTELQHFPESLKKRLSQETKLYYKTGNCSLQTEEIVAVNPTLLEPKTLNWRVDIYSCPFDSYLPLPLNELDISVTEGVAIRYCQKMLKKLVAAYQKKKKETVQFHFHLGDSLQFCRDTSEKYDVIESFNLADDVGLANLMVSCSQKLELHPYSMLLTGSSHWGYAGKTVVSYLEKCLGAPLSMIPTIYGLRLVNNVELGSHTFLKCDCFEGYKPIHLIWRQAPRLENVQLQCSPSLERCLKSLEKKCYFLEQIGNDCEKAMNYLFNYEECGNERYTPLTFHYIIESLKQRTNLQQDANKEFYKFGFPQNFSLAHRTLEDWKKRRPLAQLTIVKPFQSIIQQFHGLLQQVFNVDHDIVNSSWLRIVVLPIANYSNYVKRIYAGEGGEFFWQNWEKDMPFCQFIDNFDLCFHRNEDGCFQSVEVSFFLPAQHYLENTHSVVVIDMITGFPVLAINELRGVSQKIVDNYSSHSEPYPESKGVQQVIGMQATNCKESETEYIVQIETNINEDPGDLKISTDQELPCESAHRVTLSFDQAKGLQPLTLGFPYPVLAGNIQASFCPSDHSVQVVLKKALLEPWPCHFNEPLKWKVGEFSPWKDWRGPEFDDPRDLIEAHIGGSFSTTSDGRPLLTSHLDDIRFSIISKTMDQAFDGSEYFVIGNPKYPLKPLWHLRVHLPIRISPFLGPIALISAYDHCLADQLVADGHLKDKKFQESFQRVFHKGCKNKSVPLGLTQEGSAGLLRYVLRLNSTKMVPSTWQKENLPLGSTRTPYLATFISLLYLDNEDIVALDGGATCVNLMPTPQCCDGCGMQSSEKLMRCSQCKLAHYCTAQCQKNHWKTHKKTCTMFK